MHVRRRVTAGQTQMTNEPVFRRYDPRDAAAVVALDEWALGATETDPEDVPGREDVQDVEAAYLERGGDFVVGVLEEGSLSAVENSAQVDTLETFDGFVVAMGGFLPNENGHEDERTVPGAAELHRMRVAPPVQGRGYGEKLLDVLETRVGAAGYDLLLATTARRQRKAARFYPEHGYEHVDESQMGPYELLHFEKAIESSE